MFDPFLEEDTDAAGGRFAVPLMHSSNYREFYTYVARRTSSRDREAGGRIENGFPTAGVRHPSWGRLSRHAGNILR